MIVQPAVALTGVGVGGASINRVPRCGVAAGFADAVDRGRVAHSAAVALDEAAVIALKTGWTIEDDGPTKDWALMQLDTPLGDKYGYLGWRDLDFSNSDIIEALSERINLVGYSGDFPTESLREFGQAATTAGVDRACSILGLWSEGPFVGTIAHDCDTNPGASGGPILAKFTNDRYYIVGLHARQTPLSRPILLPDGTATRVVNGGVRVGQWAVQ